MDELLFCERLENKRKNSYLELYSTSTIRLISQPQLPKLRFKSTKSFSDEYQSFCQVGENPRILYGSKQNRFFELELSGQKITEGLSYCKELTGNKTYSLSYLESGNKCVLISGNSHREVKIWNLYTNTCSYCFPALQDTTSYTFQSAYYITSIKNVNEKSPTQIAHNGAGEIRILDLEKMAEVATLESEIEYVTEFVVDKQRNSVYATSENCVYVFDLRIHGKVGELEYQTKYEEFPKIVLRETSMVGELVCASDGYLWYYDLKKAEKIANKWNYDRSRRNNTIDMIDVPDRQGVCISRMGSGLHFVNLYNGKTVLRSKEGEYRYLMYYPGKNPFCYISREVLQKDFSEKVDFVLKEGNMEIQLGDSKKLKLWKLFFNLDDQENAPNLVEHFSRAKLEIDERNILLVLVG